MGRNGSVVSAANRAIRRAQRRIIDFKRGTRASSPSLKIDGRGARTVFLLAGRSTVGVFGPYLDSQVP